MIDKIAAFQVLSILLFATWITAIYEVFTREDI